MKMNEIKEMAKKFREDFDKGDPGIYIGLGLFGGLIIGSIILGSLVSASDNSGVLSGILIAAGAVAASLIAARAAGNIHAKYEKDKLIEIFYKEKFKSYSQVTKFVLDIKVNLADCHPIFVERKEAINSEFEQRIKKFIMVDVQLVINLASDEVADGIIKLKGALYKKGEFDPYTTELDEQATKLFHSIHKDLGVDQINKALAERLRIYKGE